MDLARPQWLPLVLGALAIVAVCETLRRRRRSRAWAAFGHAGALPGDGAGRWLLAIAAAGLALLGPRWGRTPGAALPPGHEVVLLVDVSRSMGAEDAVPNRLGAAVAGATAMVEALGSVPGERVAVVAFAGRGVLRCPLTSNLGAVRETLARLRPGDVRPGGTDLAAALAAAREAFPAAGPDLPPAGRSLVVFSDGEDLEGRGTAAIASLRAAAVVVHAVTIGDASHPGATVPVPDASGVVHPLEHDGQVVRTRRQDDTLREIAVATGGTFIPLGMARPEDVAALYQTSIRASEQAQRARMARGTLVDRSALFVAMALAAGVAALLPARGWRRAGGIALLALLAIGADRPPGAGPGLVAYQAGRLDEALRLYENDIKLYPHDATPRFNAAVVLQRLGRYDEADARYAQALARAADQPALAARIEFARGNNAYLRGDREAALAHYDACLRRSLDDPGVQAIQRDAAVNRDFVARQESEESRSEERTESGDTPSPSEKSKPESADEPNRPRAEAPPGTRGGDVSKDDPDRSAESMSPEAQLDRAIERIRQRARPGSEPRPTPVDATRRDW